MYDIILVSVPYTYVEVPPAGIAVLKGAAQSHGFTAKCLDLGMELFKECNKDREYYEHIQNNFVAPSEKINNEATSADNFIDKWAKKLANEDTRYIGISVFSYFSHLAAYMLCEKIKNINPDMKIVIGGPGCNIKISDSMFDRYKISGIEKFSQFGDILVKRKIADHAIVGDGEQALIDLLSDRYTDGNKFQIIDYKQDLPFSNFDDFNLSDYQGQLHKGLPQLPMFTSKGCVRECDFCDVKAVQSRFRFRTGKNIVKEMIYLAERYNIREFVFLDSLVNGSLKSLTEWVTELAEYNRNNPEKQIKWSGNWICRPKGQIKEPFYKLLAESGCDALNIGAESGSNHVLKAMYKKTNVESLLYEAEQFKKHNIKFITLLIVAHWSERWQDFVDTCNMLYRLSFYTRSGHHIATNIGATFGVLSDTPVDLDREPNQLEVLDKNIWWTPINPSLTIKERYFRLLLIEKFSNLLNLPPQFNFLPYAFESLKKSIGPARDFYQTHTDSLLEKPTQFAEYYLDHFDEFVNIIVEQNCTQDQSLSIEVELEASVVNELPRISVEWNNRNLVNSDLEQGVHKFQFELTPEARNNFSIEFSNKQPNDTIVDQQGNIVKDKFVLIKSFVVNGVDLVQDHDFFYNKLKYQINNVESKVSAGFWFNHSKLSLEFPAPFRLWFNQHSFRFSKLEAFVISKNSLPKALSSNSTEWYVAEIKKILRTIDY